MPQEKSSPAFMPEKATVAVAAASSTGPGSGPEGNSASCPQPINHIARAAGSTRSYGMAERMDDLAGLVTRLRSRNGIKRVSRDVAVHLGGVLLQGSGHSPLPNIPQSTECE
jgi:hypothetical protein